jgi:serine acetyltransferase
VPNTKSSIKIGNDVWIGHGAKIIEGTTIHDGAVILAGALVTKDVKPYEVVGGFPAKTIKYRFTPEEVKILTELKLWDKGFEWLKKNHQYLSDKNVFFEKFGDK